MRTNRLALVAVLLVACSKIPNVPATLAARGEVKTIPGMLVVDWKDDASPAAIEAEQKRLGLSLHLNSIESRGAELTVETGVDVTPELLARLNADPLVEDAEPGYAYDALFLPDDPSYKLQWHLQQVGAEKAWNFGTGEGVTVAVIDTGVSRLPDLARTRFVDGYDFVADKADASDDNGHGSHVAGTIAQSTDNAEGVAGLAHRASIMPLKVLDARGSGNIADIADAIRYAADHGAKVLNLSLGGGAPSRELALAVAYAHDKGCVVVCAAGNGFGAPVGYPAADEGALAVSAVRFDQTLAPYSSVGPEVALAAPGGDTTVDQNHDGQPDGVLQQTLGGDYKWFQGTSMAAPHVAAAAALLAGAGVTRAGAIERLLKDTATRLGNGFDSRKYGAGEVNAGAAMVRVRLFGGLWRLLIAFLAMMLGLQVIRRNGEKPSRFGLLGIATAVMCASGLIFLPLIGLGHSTWGSMLATPVPEWGQWLTGTMTSSPLWLSALVPFLALGFSRFKPLSGMMAGVAFGFAGYLLHAAFAGWVDIAWIPGRTLEAVWLVLNGLLAFGFGTFALRTLSRGTLR